MFFQEPETKLPRELIVRIIQYLSKTEQLGARLVCRDLQQDIDDLGIRWKTVGAANHEDFIARMQRLPPRFRQLVLSVDQYTLAFAEETVAILALPYNGRVQALLTPAQANAMPNPTCVRYLLLLEQGVIALREKLITLEQIAAMPNANYVQYLFMAQHGITSLREKLITPTQIAALPDASNITQLISNSFATQRTSCAFKK